MLTYSITKEQEPIEALNIQAAMYAHQMKTKQITKAYCKHLIAQQFTDIEQIQDMMQRVRHYLNIKLN